MSGNNLISLRAVAAGLALGVLSAFLLLFMGHDYVRASTFDPQASACLDNELTEDPDPWTPGHPQECDGDASPGANASVVTTFDIFAPDANFAVNISFIPPDWGTAAGGDVTDGALAAQLSAIAYLGLVNLPCITSLPVIFNLLDATLDMTQQVTFIDDPEDADVRGEQFEDDDNDGLPNGVELYPDYLTRILPGLVPRARLYGQTSVGGVDVSLNFLLFEPGTAIRGLIPDPSLGFPSVTVLQAIGDPGAVPTPGPITDFCSPLRTYMMTFGVTKDNPKTAGIDESGQTYRSNPSSAGSFNFVSYIASQRDADNDGHENGLDTCPLNANPNWDPRGSASIQPGQDSDGDGIGDVCDPAPNVNINPPGDHDGDLYYNRGDNCPLVANGRAAGQSNQKDSDFDGIGNDCDPTPGTPSGHLHDVCRTDVVTIGAGDGAPAVICPFVVLESTTADTNSQVAISAINRNAEGNRLPGATATFEIVSQPGTDASLSASSAQGNADGVATVTLNTGSSLGKIVVAVTAQGVTQEVAIGVGLGDVNCDEKLSIVDALLIAQLVVGLIDDVACPDQADVDASGSVRIVDALLVAQKVVGLI